MRPSVGQLRPAPIRRVLTTLQQPPSMLRSTRFVFMLWASLIACEAHGLEKEQPPQSGTRSSALSRLPAASASGVAKETDLQNSPTPETDSSESAAPQTEVEPRAPETDGSESAAPETEDE